MCVRRETHACNAMISCERDHLTDDEPYQATGGRGGDEKNENRSPGHVVPFSLFASPRSFSPSHLPVLGGVIFNPVNAF